MSLGSLGNGGPSSSSSNLSPLAVPFTVDRSNSKPNSNPLSHFIETPCAGPFHSFFQNWQCSHSSASRPDLYANLDSEYESFRTTCWPSDNDYRFLGSHSVSSTSTQMSLVNPSVSSPIDSFSFLQYSSDVPTNHIESKRYYQAFVSPVVDVVDDEIPMVTLNEPGYDLLSTSGVFPLDGSSQVDYTQSLSALEYTPQWGSVWNGLAGGNQGKREEDDGSSCLEETNVAGSRVYKNYMKQGVCTAGSSRKYEETSAVSHPKCLGILGIESQIVSPSNKSPSLQGSRFMFGESSRTLISGNSTLQDSQVQVPALESVTNFWNQRRPCTASYDRSFQPPDSCLDDRMSVKKSSRVIIRPPSIPTSSTVPDAVASEDVKSIGIVAGANNKDSGFHFACDKKEPHLSLSCGKDGCLYTSQPNLCVETSDHFVVVPPSTGKEELSKKSMKEDVLYHMPKEGVEVQHPDNKVLDGFTVALDSAEGFISLEDSSESLDDYNLAVDSPCWKGASVSRCSPFEVPEATTPEHSMKKLEACSGLNLQQTQIIPSCSDDTAKVSCQSPSENNLYQENGYVELGSLLCPERLSNTDCLARKNGSGDAVKAGSNYSNISSDIGVQFSDGIDKPRKEYDSPNDSKSEPDLKSSYTEQPEIDKDEFIPGREFKLCSGLADTRLNVNDTVDTPEHDSFSFHGMECSSDLPAEDVHKLPKLHATRSTPKLDVGMLVNTIYNLSELLLSHFSNDSSAILEKDQKALKLAINNLDAYVSKKIEPMKATTATQEPVFCPQGTSHECRKLPYLHKGVVAGRHLVTKEACSSPHGQFDHHSMHERERNTNLSSNDVEKFPADFIFFSDDDNIVKDNNMVQAIKKILEGDCKYDEEMQSETLLYKNLWLEAEASLCSMNYRARFNRMKIEMEKCKSQNSKEVKDTTKAVKKFVSSKGPPDPNITRKVRPEDKDSPISDNSIQDSPILSATKIVDDVEASVMARFHVLKCRGQNSNSASTEQVEVAFNAGLAGTRNHWPFVGNQSEDGGLGVCDGHKTQIFRVNSKEDKFGSAVGGSKDETAKDFDVCPSDDQVIRNSMNNELGILLPSGWSPSDWEHVLKDEFTCHSC